MAFTVVYDANALYGATLRDLLIRIAQAGLVQAKWTDQILDEMLRALRRKYPDIDEDKLQRLRGLIVAAVPDCIVRGYEPIIEGLKIADPKDRHVLAAAIRCEAQVIVTSDRDFTAAALEPWGIEAKTPDEFVLDQIDIADKVIWGAVQQIADSRTFRPETVEDVLSQLERSGLLRSVAALRGP
jgi:predicted nucleic acid-binding protein